MVWPTLAVVAGATNGIIVLGEGIAGVIQPFVRMRKCKGILGKQANYHVVRTDPRKGQVRFAISSLHNDCFGEPPVPAVVHLEVAVEGE